MKWLLCAIAGSVLAGATPVNAAPPIRTGTYLATLDRQRQAHERWALAERRKAERSVAGGRTAAAFHSEQRAFVEELAVNAELKRELAYARALIDHYRGAAGPRPGAPQRRADRLSFGWGTL